VARRKRDLAQKYEADGDLSTAVAEAPGGAPSAEDEVGLLAQPARRAKVGIDMEIAAGPTRRPPSPPAEPRPGSASGSLDGASSEADPAPSQPAPPLAAWAQAKAGANQQKAREAPQNVDISLLEECPSTHTRTRTHARTHPPPHPLLLLSAQSVWTRRPSSCSVRAATASAPTASTLGWRAAPPLRRPSATAAPSPPARSAVPMWRAP
jgi:hypothetical protein